MLKRILVCLFIVGMSPGCAKPVTGSVSTEQTGLAVGKTTTSCGFKFSQSGTCLLWTWEVAATEDTPGSFIFRTFKIDALDSFPVLVPPVSVPFVKLWMPTMGHGSSPVTVEQITPGTYRAKNVFFVMPGNWEIQFQIREGAKVVDEAIARFTL